MQKLTLSRIGCILLLALAPLGATAAQGGKIGEVQVVVDNQLAVRVTANSAELQSLALAAFNSHGRYDVTGRRAPAYDIKFTAMGPTQVRVDVTRGTAPVVSQVVSGHSARNALLRAADIAVEKTNGEGLRGYFAGRLAFVTRTTGKTEICVSDLFMGEMKRLTSDGALSLSPRWSPDGARLIYTSYYKSGFPDIFLLDPNTGRKDTFVSVKGTNTGARFSPSGQQVAMVLSGEGTPEIYVSNAQGRGIVRKTRSDAAKSSPCWSPDGSRLVFTMQPGPQLYVLPVVGGAPRRLASGFSYMAEPDWSRTEPNKIACTVGLGRQFQIAVVDASSGQAQVASKAAFDGIEPSWLEDGRHLVYTARDRRSSVLCILDTKTGKSTPISLPALAAEQVSVWFQ